MPRAPIPDEASTVEWSDVTDDKDGSIFTAAYRGLHFAVWQEFFPWQEFWSWHVVAGWGREVKVLAKGELCDSLEQAQAECLEHATKTLKVSKEARTDA